MNVMRKHKNTFFVMLHSCILNIRLSDVAVTMTCPIKSKFKYVAVTVLVI